MLLCFIFEKPETQASKLGFAASYAVQKYYKMLIWQDKEVFYSDKINKNIPPVFTSAVRNSLPPERTAERICRTAPSFHPGTASFTVFSPKHIPTRYFRPAYPLSRPMSHPYLSMGGTWDGTVGDLCFAFGFDASSRNENAHGTWTRRKSIARTG